jgi:hypothetical protein
LIQVGSSDLDLPLWPMRRAAARAGARATLIEYPGVGHFGFGDLAVFDRVSADQLAFLRRVLAPADRKEAVRA